MAIKFRLIILLILGVSTNAFCCLDARQERIIPIGTSENCLIGIEVISNRYGAGEYGQKAVWDFKFRLVGFNENYSDFLIKELSFEQAIENNQVEQILSDRIEKAIEICNTLSDFELLYPKSIKFCDYQKECAKLSLIETDKNLKFKVKGEKESHSIKFLKANYKGEIAKPYKEYFDFYFEDAVVGKDLKISSMREFENSSFKLLIFHLGTGQEFEDLETAKIPDKKEMTNDKELKTIKDAIFVEPILHHGKGFDYFKMDEK